MRRFLVLLPLLLFAGVGVFFAYGLKRDPSNIPSQLINRPLPHFELAAIEGRDEGLASMDFGGEVMLLNVFASWCLSCQIEHPVLMELSRQNAVPIHGLNWKDKPGDGKAWLDRLGNPYTRIGDDWNGRVAIDLGVTGAPETFVIDRNGRVRYKFIGPITPQAWEEELAPLIEELRGQ